MLGIFGNKESPLLDVKVNGESVCQIFKSELPCEKTPSIQLKVGRTIEFIDSEGIRHVHGLGGASGWYHFSVRVHANLACQVDCAITQSKEYDQEAFSKGAATGIRFQPFFISGAEVTNDVFSGKGLFKRGLHFSGNVTNGAILLSCECERCKNAFLIHSFHAGFSNLGYFYSGSGQYTLTVSSYIPGAPVALSTPNPGQLSELEARLPKAPDGTEFKYNNPFRCPHCKAPYIDFQANPEERQAEYYGNYFFGSELMRFEEPRR